MKKLLNFLLLAGILSLNACSTTTPEATTAETAPSSEKMYPSDVLPFMDQWRILLGDGTQSQDLVGYEDEDFFYATTEGDTDWVVYKTPNSGVTSPNSGNTRTELGQIHRWTPEEGGKLTGTLKVVHVSTSGDASVAASFSTVVGQIHSEEGHENEPLKIFYKKFPGHTKGSVFWNYEINTAGEDNAGRWDYSTAIWGHDMSVIGSGPDDYPAEPEEGIELGEEFHYEIVVKDGIMDLLFTSEDHETVTFTKDLLNSEFTTAADIPEQTQNLFVPIGQDGVERANAYAGESQFFKQGAYNQTNGKDPSTNRVWSTGAETYGGDIPKQYANGSYTEVWFREGTLERGNE